MINISHGLQGQFQDLWDHIRITPGDVLTFEKDASNPLSIKISKHDNGQGFEDLFQSSSKRKPAAAGGQQCRMQEHVKVPVSDTPWIFTDPQTASKALTSHHLAKMRCEIPDTLYQRVCSMCTINQYVGLCLCWCAWCADLSTVQFEGHVCCFRRSPSKTLCL